MLSVLRFPSRNVHCITLVLELDLSVALILPLNCSADKAIHCARLHALLKFDGWYFFMFQIPVLANALGGILVGLVTSHAGGVRKVNVI